MRNARLFQKLDQFRQRFVLVDDQDIGGAANLQGSFGRQRHSHPVFDAQRDDGRNQIGIANDHDGVKFLPPITSRIRI